MRTLALLLFRRIQVEEEAAEAAEGEAEHEQGALLLHLPRRPLDSQSDRQVYQRPKHQNNCDFEVSRIE